MSITQAEIERLRKVCADEYATEVQAATVKRDARLQALDWIAANAGTVSGVANATSPRSGETGEKPRSAQSFIEGLPKPKATVSQAVAGVLPAPPATFDMHIVRDMILMNGWTADEVKVETVATALKRLVDKGSIRIIKPGGHRVATVYTRVA